MAPTVIFEVELEPIRAAWSKETSAEPDLWSQENPAWGQCAVTALIVQDMYGGELVRSLVNGVSHYWNRLDDGMEVDLTLEQFCPGPIIRSVPEFRERAYVLSFEPTVRRYRQLQENLEAAMSGPLD